MGKIKIGYFADGPWSHKAFDKLLLDTTVKVKFVCARSDFPDPVLRDKCTSSEIDFIVHPRINSDDFLTWMERYRCDLFVSMSFNQIFGPRLINLPALKTINCHAGKLPFYRGRNILNWALINDEKEFGITTHYVDEGIDTGDIILQNCYPITDEDCYSTLLQCAYKECANNLYDAIKIVQSGIVKVTKQDDIDKLGFYCTARKAGDEVLDWNQTSRDVFNFVRSICRPGPEARVYLGDAEVKINRVKFLPNAKKYKGIVGSVVGTDEHCFYVKTIDSFIQVTDWSGNVRPCIGDRFS